MSGSAELGGITNRRLTSGQSDFLDLLRGVAAQMVVVGHIHSTAHPGKTSGLGDLGVIVFFILSGFLICYSALSKQNRGGYGIGPFVRDRGFRIFVPYVPALVLIVALDSLVLHYTTLRTYEPYYTVQDFIATLLLLQQHPLGLAADQLFGMQWLKLSTFGSARPWWTVANEWWLYMMFGLLVFGRPLARRRKWVYVVVLTMAAVVPLFNFVAGTGAGLSLIWFVAALLAWAYLYWGATIDTWTSAFLKSGTMATMLVVFIVLGLLALSVARVVWISFIEPGFVFTRPEFYDFNLYFLLLILFGVIMAILGSARRSRRQPVIRFMADYSYSLYLVHYSLIYALYAIGYLRGDDWWSMVTCYVACNMLGVLFYFLFERHFKAVQVRYERWLSGEGTRVIRAAEGMSGSDDKVGG